LGGLGLGSVLGNRLSVVVLLDVAGGLFVLSGAVALVLLPTAVRANELVLTGPHDGAGM
jgi:hypothetical protein